MLVAVATLGALVLALLLVPVGLEVRIGGDEPDAPARRKLRLSWPAGLVAFDLPRRSRAAREDDRPPPTSSKPTTRAAGPPAASAPARMMRLLRSRGFMGAVAKLLRRLFLATHPRRVKVSLVLGLDDPADTGQLWAALGPLSAGLWSVSDGALAVEPDFCRSRAVFTAEGRFTIIPAHVIGILLAFALSPTMLRAARRASWG